MFWIVRGIAGAVSGGASYDLFLTERTGQTWGQFAAQNPAIATLINLIVVEGGVFMLAFGALGMAISRVSYRRGERWSWYVFWVLPATLLGLLALRVSIIGTLFDGVALLVVLLLVVSLLGLMLPFRMFFPKGPM